MRDPYRGRQRCPVCDGCRSTRAGALPAARTTPRFPSVAERVTAQRPPLHRTGWCAMNPTPRFAATRRARSPAARTPPVAACVQPRGSDCRKAIVATPRPCGCPCVRVTVRRSTRFERQHRTSGSSYPTTVRRQPVRRQPVGTVPTRTRDNGTLHACTDPLRRPRRSACRTAEWTHPARATCPATWVRMPSDESMTMRFLP